MWHQVMDSGGPAPDAGPKRRRVSPAAAAAARVPETWAFCAGRADDGLSKCRGCRTRIEPGALRVGKIRRGRQQEGGQRELAWFSAACCLGHKDLKDLYSTALLFEFGALEPAEQEAVAVGLERASVTRIDEKQMLSRLLYPNPVCMLSTPAHAATGGPNVMTISWLTPLNNFGLVLLSVNAKRHTAAKLRGCPDFVLNIPAHGLEETVLAIGKHSGAQGDKFAKLGIEVCAFFSSRSSQARERSRCTDVCAGLAASRGRRAAGTRGGGGGARQPLCRAGSRRLGQRRWL